MRDDIQSLVTGKRKLSAIARLILGIPDVRKNPLILFILSLVINIGMWSERLMIVVVSLHRDFVPSSWGLYYPTFGDWATLLGTIGLFIVGFLIMFRIFPMFANFEVSELAAILQKRRNNGSKQPTNCKPDKNLRLDRPV